MEDRKVAVNFLQVGQVCRVSVCHRLIFSSGVTFFNSLDMNTSTNKQTNPCMHECMSACVRVGVFTPGMAADDVGEYLWQARGVFEVFFRVVPVDSALCVAIPVFLSLGQVVIARLHCCQQEPL